MILGYVILVQDSNNTMFSDIKLPKCAKYSNVYDLNIIDENLKFKGKKNLSCTYDGFTIVSQKFKQFCEDEKYAGLEFVQLPSSPNFYWFKIHNIIEYDTKAAWIRFINYSEECNGYEEIIGAHPACLKNNKEELSDGFFRSDFCFGSYEGKSPLEMVGEATMKKLKSAGFKEIFFEKIMDKYKWQESGKDPNEIIIKS